MRVYLAAPASNFDVAGSFRLNLARGITYLREQGQSTMNLRLLVSFYYYQHTDLDALFQQHFTEPYPDVFADSGAYSAMTQGKPIDIGAYADWLHRWKHRFAAYANLDVIKNAEQTWANQQALEARGLQPVPVFHVLEDFRWLEHYVERYPYIALGVAGMQARKDAMMRWITRCFQIAGDRAVFHGFALTSWLVMASFPWYSVDSTSWGQGFRFGQVPLFDAQRGRIVKAQLGDRASCYRYAGLFQALGFDPADFADRSRNDRAKICGASILSYLKAERWLRKRHGEVRIPTRLDDPPGPRVFLVTAQSHPSADKGSNMSIGAIAKALSGVNDAVVSGGG